MNGGKEAKSPACFSDIFFAFLTEVWYTTSCKEEDIMQYDKLIKERGRLLSRFKVLAGKNIIRGSIRVQGNRCGTKGCRCKRERNPILHGPYPYLSYRGKKKNHSILLTKKKDLYAEGAIANYKKLMDTIIALSDVDFQILRYYSDRVAGKKAA